jgi:Glycosyltransferase WbsX
MNKKARVIAFYLPQFHPIPENNEWWGKGFTEWTNVGKATPLFKGHYQPRIPADLGYYDLRLPEIREAQAEMAKNSGVEGFMYWHYWFGNNKTILERPFKEVLDLGKPDFPFCLGWANHSWTNRTWIAKEQKKAVKILMQQEYPGEKDYIDHFNYILKALKDPRYMTVDGKPIFYIYSPLSFSEINLFITTWRNLAKENGLDGIHFIGQATRNSDCQRILDLGFDAVCRVGEINAAEKIRGKYTNKIFQILHHRFFNIAPLNKLDYSEIIKHLIDQNIDEAENIYPTIIPNYDHTARSGRKALIYHKSNPDLFKILIKKAVETVQNKKDEHKIIFLRSWNEWAEGNYMEPDIVHGYGYLNALKDEIISY